MEAGVIFLPPNVFFPHSNSHLRPTLIPKPHGQVLTPWQWVPPSSPHP